MFPILHGSEQDLGFEHEICIYNFPEMCFCFAYLFNEVH